MKFITKRAVLAAAILSATALTGGSVGAQSSSTMYLRIFYSDASLTTVVGTYTDRCRGNTAVASPVNGIVTPYYTLEAVGSCPGGYW